MGELALVPNPGSSYTSSGASGGEGEGEEHALLVHRAVLPHPVVDLDPGDSPPCRDGGEEPGTARGPDVEGHALAQVTGLVTDDDGGLGRDPVGDQVEGTAEDPPR